MSYDYAVEVVNVVDGDTVDLRVDLGFYMTAALRFRVLAVDTPERGMRGFTEATEFTRAWLAQHTNLRARTFRADSFGRWLADIYDADTGAYLSEALLVAKMGVPYVR